MLPYILWGWGGRKFIHLDIITIQIKFSLTTHWFVDLFFFPLLLYRQKAYSVHVTARIRKQSTCLKICIPLKVVRGSFPNWQCLQWTSTVHLILSAFYFNLHPLFTLRGTNICRALFCSETMSWNDRADHLDLFRLGSWGSEISIPLPVFRDQSYLLLPDSNIFPLDNGRHNRSISIFFHFFQKNILMNFY